MNKINSRSLPGLEELKRGNKKNVFMPRIINAIISDRLNLPSKDVDDIMHISKGNKLSDEQIKYIPNTNGVADTDWDRSWLNIIFWRKSWERSSESTEPDFHIEPGVPIEEEYINKIKGSFDDEEINNLRELGYRI